jgi:hypothetical protein
VNAWIEANGGDYGFTATVRASRGTGSGGAGDRRRAGRAGSRVQGDLRRAVVPAGGDAAGRAQPSATSIDAWIDLKNVGKKTWTANTRLAPTPRDQPSPLADAGWLSPTRITGPEADTPAGAVGRFASSSGRGHPGDYYQTFGLVEEGVTWFSDRRPRAAARRTTSSRCGS